MGGDHLPVGPQSVCSQRFGHKDAPWDDPGGADGMHDHPHPDLSGKLPSGQYAVGLEGEPEEFLLFGCAGAGRVSGAHKERVGAQGDPCGVWSRWRKDLKGASRWLCVFQLLYEPGYQHQRGG